MPDISQINIPNNDGSMTYNIKDASVPHSSLPATSGGTDLSLVTTGEKAEWQDKGNYVIRGTNTTSNTFGHWTGNIPIPELYNGLTITYICSRNTKEVSSCDLELTFPNGSTSGRVEVLFDDGVNVSTEYQRNRCLTLTYFDADHTYWGEPGWIVISPSVLQWYVDNTKDGNYPLLFSEYAGRVTLNTTNCGAYKDTTFWYNPSTHNLHAEKVNGYTLASACEKQVDAEVEQSSDNLPTSDAVYNAINNIHIQTKTVSGAIATFNDASGDVPFATLKSDINPVQDLHGYSKPWSGGGGKNKLEVTATTITKNGITFTVKEDGSVVLNGTATAHTEFALNASNSLKSGTYIVNGVVDGVGNTRRILVRSSNSVIATDTGSGAEFSLENDTNVSVSITISNGEILHNVTWYPMIRLASVSDASFEPYSNICPISGFSALNVTLADGDMQTVESKTVNFGQTVYGGVADVTNGKVTITHIKITDFAQYYRDFFSGTYSTEYRITLPYPSTNVVYSVKRGSLCNCKEEETAYYGANQSSQSGSARDIFAINPLGEVLAIYDADTTLTKEQFEAKYSGNIEFVYELATPIEITTAPENLTAISGENNVYGDTNGDTTVEYFSGDCAGVIKLLKALSVI